MSTNPNEPGEKPSAAEEMEKFFAQMDEEERTRRRGPLCTYTLVHTDGSLGEFTGDRADLIDHLDRTQGRAYCEGEMASESLEDLPGIDAVWVACYTPDRLPQNPIAAQMVQVFDFGEVPSWCRGTVAFGPYFAQERSLKGHRRDLLLKIHDEILRAHRSGEGLRKFLWPSEMITASRGLSPAAAWREFDQVRPQVPEGTRVTDFFREHEARQRAIESYKQRHGETAEYYND